ncbi:MAG: hypothetical protein KBD52_00220 [Candidatus Pacebacteria bacterium]|nr:hypothetical protein [Candidatus Paceibacterota bacterium]
MSILTYHGTYSEKKRVHKMYVLPITISEVTREKKVIVLFDINLTFPGIRKYLGNSFMSYIEPALDFCDAEDQVYEYFHTDILSNMDSGLISNLGIKRSSPEEIIANVEFLSSHPEFLKIEGGKEVNFILGYDVVDRHVKAICIKHRKRWGKNEIHFFTQRLNRWGKKAPNGFAKR